MTTLIGAMRCIATDYLWYVKFMLFSIILFLLMINKELISSYGQTSIYIYFIPLAIMIGFGTISMNRNINNISPLFPNFLDFPEIIFKSILSVIIMIPGTLVLLYTYNFIRVNFILPDHTMNIILFIIICFFLPFIFIPLVLYSVRNNITDIFRLDIIFKSSGNFIVKTLGFVIEHILTVTLLSFLLYISLLNIFGDKILSTFVLSFAITYTFFLFFIFCANMYDEEILRIKSK